MPRPTSIESSSKDRFPETLPTTSKRQKLTTENFFPSQEMYPSLRNTMVKSRVIAAGVVDKNPKDRHLLH
jgi:hypothetical protein